MRRLQIDPDASQVWIEGSSSVHPVHATATGLTGWIEVPAPGRRPRGATVAGEVRIAVERLRSGNSLVDRETRRRIDAGNHPEIVGSVTAATSLEAERWQLTGDLTFRGEVRSVTGEVTVSADGSGVVLEGSQRFDVRDWGLTPPRVGLLRVHPEIEVRIHVFAG